MIKNNLKIPENINQIVEYGMCMGCGLCQAITGKSKIKFVITPEGRVRPLEISKINQEDWKIIKKTCPGINVVGPETQPNKKQTDLLWGPIKTISLGYASNADVRYRATSGGVLTALSHYLIKSKMVKFIIQVKPSTTNPTLSETIFSFSEEEVFQASGSRYGPTTPLDSIKFALDLEENFAFVGKPCDANALKLFSKEDPRVDQFCKFILTMVCGGCPEYMKTTDLIKNLGYEEKDVNLMRYRGFGNPGKARVETKDGKDFEFSYKDLWSDQTKWFSQARCRICPDGIGELADIVSGDFWPGCDPEGEDEGFNSIIVRTEKGMSLYENAVSSGFLTIDKSLTVDDMSQTQPHQVVKKQEAWARLIGLKKAGHIIPKVEGLRLREIAKRQSLKQNLKAARGAKKRSHDGRLKEPIVKEIKN